ncbi:hypothetical protein B0H13DRAFT_1929404 [Mycena leptocephala]|nr:hypothetical protein B0H13DRAFT_1929404 [Mycena leptocephala]
MSLETMREGRSVEAACTTRNRSSRRLKNTTAHLFEPCRYLEVLQYSVHSKRSINCRSLYPGKSDVLDAKPAMRVSTDLSPCRHTRFALRSVDLCRQGSADPAPTNHRNAVYYLKFFFGLSRCELYGTKCILPVDVAEHWPHWITGFGVHRLGEVDPRFLEFIFNLIAFCIRSSISRLLLNLKSHTINVTPNDELAFMNCDLGFTILADARVQEMKIVTPCEAHGKQHLDIAGWSRRPEFNIPVNPTTAPPCSALTFHALSALYLSETPAASARATKQEELRKFLEISRLLILLGERGAESGPKWRENGELSHSSAVRRQSEGPPAPRRPEEWRGNGEISCSPAVRRRSEGCPAPRRPEEWRGEWRPEKSRTALLCGDGPWPRVTSRARQSILCFAKGAQRRNIRMVQRMEGRMEKSRTVRLYGVTSRARQSIPCFAKGAQRRDVRMVQREERK